ncbi:hypothetical protein MTO96_040452 [Rhipicephalus appendiculatus]
MGEKKRSDFCHGFVKKYRGFVGCVPAELQGLKCEDAVKFLGERSVSTCKEIAELYKHFTKKQHACDTENEFVMEIPETASRPGIVSELDRTHRNRIVCGIRDASVRLKQLTNWKCH